MPQAHEAERRKRPQGSVKAVIGPYGEQPSRGGALAQREVCAHREGRGQGGDGDDKRQVLWSRREAQICEDRACPSPAPSPAVIHHSTLTSALLSISHLLRIFIA